jgi:hypothetical protein
VELDSSGFLLIGCVRAYAMGIAPEPQNNPRGVGWGVFIVREPLDPNINIPLWISSAPLPQYFGIYGPE